MKPHLQQSLYLLLFGLLVIGQTGAFAQEFEKIGGPYEPDEHTILLLNFDDEGPINTAGRTEDGEVHGDVRFLEHGGLPEGFGLQAYFNNASPQEHSYITIPDTTYLDLTGNWTIELWIHILTFGETLDDHRAEPRFLFKAGGGDYWWWQGNYWVYARGHELNFYTGYYDDTGRSSNYHDLITPEGSLRAREWIHFAYIRDTVSNVHAQAVHRFNDDGELVLTEFVSDDFDPVEDHPPQIQESPLYLGQSSNDTHFLDGFMDEVRISDVVRQFELPPLVTAVSQPGTVGSDDQANIGSRIVVLGEEQPAQRALHYRVNGGDWQEVGLDNVEMNEYEGVIPEQEHGNIVEYYVSAETSTGLSAVSPEQALDEENPEYYSYAVVDPQSPLLGLDFNEGEGVPLDTYSAFPHEVQVFGQPTYSDDAIVGDYSIHLADDTTYYLVDSPALGTSEIQLELWFKADSIPDHDTRLIGRRGSPSWPDMNYEIKFQEIDEVKGYLSAGAHLQGQDPAINTPAMTNELILDEPIVSDMWYHAIFRVSENVEADSSLATLQLRRADYIDDLENPLDSPPNQHSAYPFFFDEITVTPGGPLFIGRLFSGSQYFSGKVDGIRLYNYEKDPQEFDPELVSAEKIAGEIPRKVSLEANYPNPFNPSTNISYAIPDGEHVTLTVYDVLGREVARLVDEHQSAGSYTVRFDAAGLSSGLYIYRLETSTTRLTRQMMFVK